MKARIVDGKVAKVMDAAKLGLLPPHLQAEFIDAPDGTEVGDLFDGVSYTKPPPSPADVAEKKLSAINAECDKALGVIKQGYPESEIATWDKQEAEARAYAANPAASVPFISSLATERGLTVAELAARIVAKADAYIAASSAAIGKRQRLEDQVGAILADAVMTDTEKVAAINLVAW